MANKNDLALSALQDSCLLVTERVSGTLWVVVSDPYDYKEAPGNLKSNSQIAEAYSGGVYAFPSDFVDETASAGTPEYTKNLDKLTFRSGKRGKRIIVVDAAYTVGFEAEAVIAVDHDVTGDSFAMACSRPTTTLVHIISWHRLDLDKGWVNAQCTFWKYHKDAPVLQITRDEYALMYFCFRPNQRYSDHRAEWKETQRDFLTQRGIDSNVLDM